VSTLKAFHSSADAATYTVTGVAAPAGDLLVVVGAGTKTANIRTPTVTGLGGHWSLIASATAPPVKAGPARIYVFRTTISTSSSGSVVVSFGAGQLDVHVAISAVSRLAPGSGGIGVIATGSGTGTSGSAPLVGYPSSRTFTAFIHEANELSSPRPGYIELTDTKHGARPSGMSTQWHAGAMDPSPGATWATSSRWAGVSLELVATPV
jgi:hypothetical protein